MEVTEYRRLTIEDASQAGEARRIASMLAERLGFGATECGKVAIVVTEIATNLVKHARHGELLLRELSAGRHAGVGLLALDRGPGIRDLAGCLRDGFSSAGTPGTGLGAVLRLSERFDIFSGPPGTAVVARMWADGGSQVAAREPLAIGAVSLPLGGETMCGDAWAVVGGPGRSMALVVDGLGHGPDAAEAAQVATQSFRANAAAGTPAEIVRSLHDALRGTRGAAALVVELDAAHRTVRVAGIGNVAGSIEAGGSSRSMVSHHGVLGHEVRKIGEFAYPWPAGALVVLHSDGIGSRWRLDDYPGLSGRDPMLTAGLLYRDFRRARDDATVVVLREAS
jgi:anti-sigma regulatory factor (Ser/Thr protein kinase)